LEDQSIVAERATECKRGQSGVEVGEVALVVLCPYDMVVVLDDKGVDPVEGLEVVEVTRHNIRSEMAGNIDVYTSSILE
jgi:hypothetical protein